MDSLDQFQASPFAPPGTFSQQAPLGYLSGPLAFPPQTQEQFSELSSDDYTKQFICILLHTSQVEQVSQQQNADRMIHRPQYLRYGDVPVQFIPILKHVISYPQRFQELFDNAVYIAQQIVQSCIGKGDIALSVLLVGIGRGIEYIHKQVITKSGGEAGQGEDKEETKHIHNSAFATERLKLYFAIVEQRQVLFLDYDRLELEHGVHAYTAVVACRSVQKPELVALVSNALELFDPSLYVHVRLLDVPSLRTGYHGHISQLRATDVNKLVWVRGSVAKSGQGKVLETHRLYRCGNCKFEFQVRSDISLRNVFDQPAICPSGEQLQPEPAPKNKFGKKSSSAMSKKCRCSTFEYVDKSSQNRDYQEIRLQEGVEFIQSGRIPRSLTLVLMDDLVGSLTVGSDVTVTGVIWHQWHTFTREQRCDLDQVLVVNAVDFSKNNADGMMNVDTSTQNKDDMYSNISTSHIIKMKHQLTRYKNNLFALRGILINSVASKQCGLHKERLGLLMCLCGGASQVHKDSKIIKTRGTSHILIVGDAGVGKSQLLQYAAKVTPRSVMTTGSGSSSAGLTVAAVNSGNGEWSLEAGALLLANNGICCIDEFSGMKDIDRNAIYEAMEQQTISIAKAGFVATLPAKAMIFAVQNPKGKYQYDQDQPTNTGITAALLSRFDLIFILSDRDTKLKDQQVTESILNKLPLPQNQRQRQDKLHKDVQFAVCHSNVYKTRAQCVMQVDHPMKQVDMDSSSWVHESESPFDIDKKYSTDDSTLVDSISMKMPVPSVHTGIYKSPDQCNSTPYLPSLSVPLMRDFIYVQKHGFQPRQSSLARDLLATFYQKQRADTYNENRTTVRMLESQVRLTQAHAKLRLRSIATYKDAIQAVLLIETATQQARYYNYNDNNDTVDPIFPLLDSKQTQPLRTSLGVCSLGILLDKTQERVETGQFNSNTNLASLFTQDYISSLYSITLDAKADIHSTVELGGKLDISGYYSLQMPEVMPKKHKIRNLVCKQVATLKPSQEAFVNSVKTQHTEANMSQKAFFHDQYALKMPQWLQKFDFHGYFDMAVRVLCRMVFLARCVGVCMWCCAYDSRDVTEALRIQQKKPQNDINATNSELCECSTQRLNSGLLYVYKRNLPSNQCLCAVEACDKHYDQCGCKQSVSQVSQYIFELLRSKQIELDTRQFFQTDWEVGTLPESVQCVLLGSAFIDQGDGEYLLEYCTVNNDVLLQQNVQLSPYLSILTVENVQKQEWNPETACDNMCDAFLQKYGLNMTEEEAEQEKCDSGVTGMIEEMDKMIMTRTMFQEKLRKEKKALLRQFEQYIAENKNISEHNKDDTSNMEAVDNYNSIDKNSNSNNIDNNNNNSNNNDSSEDELFGLLDEPVGKLGVREMHDQFHNDDATDKKNIVCIFDSDDDTTDTDPRVIPKTVETVADFNQLQVPPSNPLKRGHTMHQPNAKFPRVDAQTSTVLAVHKARLQALQGPAAVNPNSITNYTKAPTRKTIFDEDEEEHAISNIATPTSHVLHILSEIVGNPSKATMFDSSDSEDE